MKRLRSAFLVLSTLALMAAGSAQASFPAQLTYGPTPEHNSYFGQWVMREPGWDRYLMYFSINSAVYNGKPSNVSGNSSYNYTCGGTWWGDRIWLTWHFGDGKTPSGWNANDGYGNIPPLLMLDIGGTGESGLIGDPTVAYWNGKWHMFYEGTDDCTGNNNRIFHATANNWAGPWVKQGMVWGLYGNMNGSGLSWPTVLVENGELYLYFTDGSVRLMAAQAIDSTGHNFYMMNYYPNKPLAISGAAQNPAPVVWGASGEDAWINRGQVVKTSTGYKLIYDSNRETKIRTVTSTNKFSFYGPSSTIVHQSGFPYWENELSGLPSYLKVGTEERIYYTGRGTYYDSALGRNVRVYGIGVFGP